MVVNQLTVLKLRVIPLALQISTVLSSDLCMYNKGVKFRASQNKKFDDYSHHSTPIRLSSHPTIYRLVDHNRSKNYHLRICTSLYRNIMPVFQDVQDIHIILNELERSYMQLLSHCYRR